MEEVEAIALENGVLLAQEMNLTDIIVECTLCCAIHPKEGAEWQYWSYPLGDSFSSFCLSLLENPTLEKGVQPAHELAHLASASGVTQIWKGMNLSCIQFLLRQECI